jgi:hypothetical protein
MAEVIAQAEGIRGELILFPDRIRIKRKGIRALSIPGLAGEKDIFIKDISSVHFKDAGIFSNGYIQFSFTGSVEARIGPLGVLGTSPAFDENTIMFNKKQQPDFMKIRDRIQAMKSSTFLLDELEKLSSLKDKGVITEAEFNQRKKQILGQAQSAF